MPVEEIHFARCAGPCQGYLFGYRLSPDQSPMEYVTTVAVRESGTGFPTWHTANQAAHAAGWYDHRKCNCTPEWPLLAGGAALHKEKCRANRPYDIICPECTSAQSAS